MRLAGLLMVPMASVAISVVGVYVAAPAGADCEARNGTMLCTDAPAPGDRAHDEAAASADDPPF